MYVVSQSLLVYVSQHFVGPDRTQTNILESVWRVKSKDKTTTESGRSTRASRSVYLYDNNNLKR